MHLAVRRLTVPLVAIALAAACVGPSETDQVNIPEGSFIYKITPSLLTFEYIDTTAGHHTEETWLSSQGFIGYNCFAFLPTTPTDTTGSFVFGWAGPNTGMLEQRTSTLTDTVTAYFIGLSLPGTRGTYIVDSSGKLTLNWDAGPPDSTRYFAPSSVIRLFGDTVEVRADVRLRADSIRAQWHVYWTYSPACP